MDPNHWSNFNQQAYSRLAAHSGGIPGSAAAAAALNRYDLPVIDQGTIASGLGPALTSSMAAHSSLPQQRPLHGIPVNYGHHMHGPVSQFLDTMNSLQPGFVGQAAYKPVSVAPPVAPSPYGLESSVRSHAEITSGLSHYSTSPSAISPVPKPLLFNTDPHTMKETAPLSTGFSNVTSASPVNESPKNSWQLSNFVPPPSNPFGNLSTDLGSGSAGYGGILSPEPPPAHSGSRPSTIQRNPYQSSSGGGGSKLHYAEPAHALARPAHSPHSHASFIDSVLRETRSAAFSSASASHHSSLSSSASHHQSSEAPPIAHSGSHNRSSHHHTFASPRAPVQHPVSSPSPSTFSSMPPLAGLSSFGSFNPLTTSHYITTSSTATYTSPAMDSLNYDPVSPATPAADPQVTNHSNPASDTGSFNAAMALQDLPDLSNARQDKMSLHERRGMRGSVPVSPQHMSSLTNSPHHMAAPTTSPQHQATPINMPKVMDGSSPHTSLQQSPLQASPISVGSPQIPMSMGSPQQPIIGSSTCAVPPPVTVQAVADSTTHKPKRKRGRKKNDAKMAVSIMNEPMTYITEPPRDMSHPMNTQQHYTPSPGHVSAYDTPPGGSTYEASPMQQMQQQCQSFENMTSHVTPQPINTGYNHPPQAPVFDNQSMPPMPPVVNQTFSPPASTPTPSTPSMSTNSYDSTMTLPMVAGNMATQEGYNNKPLDDDQVFMTNTFGHDFVSPNDVLGMTNVLPEPVAAPHVPEESVLSEQIPLPVKMKHKTKAEQKQMPISITYDDEEDDEFKHLLVEPVIPEPSSGVIKKRSPGRPHKAKLSEYKPPPVAPPAPPKPKLHTPNSAFQSSFLSFIQGKKQETLSSVTNSTIHRKPQLPKYVPDHRPRVTNKTVKKKAPPPPPPKRTPDEDKFSDSNSTADSKSLDVPSVTFSEDEDTAHNISKTVQNVISNLSDDSNSTAAPASTPTSDSLTFAPIKTPASADSKRGKRGGRPLSKHKGSASKKAKGKKKYDEDSNSEADPDFQPDVEYSIESSTVVDPDFVPDANDDESGPTPPPLRIKVQRKAKTKTEEKKSKKKKRKKSSVLERDDDIQSLSDASISLSSGEELIPVSSSEEKDYDSDKDPAWTPFAQVRAASSGSEDEGGRHRGRGRGRGKRAKTAKPGRGRGRRRSSAIAGRAAFAAQLPETEELQQDNDDDGEERVHNYQKGNFLIEKKDLQMYDSFPLWKIDAGRLLQKFGPVFKNGKLIHQALSTYSSWTDSMKKLYKPILVESLHSGGPESVEVLEKYRPKPPSSEPGQFTNLENDELMQTFNVYMQILISQALEPGFIDAIRDSGDNTDYYLEPFNKIDAMIQNKLNSLESELNWTKEFKDSVNSHHCLTLTDLKGTKGHCQACGDHSVEALKVAQLYGEEYNRETLESKGSSENQDFCIGEDAATQLLPYHTLLHFKFTLFKRCVAKSGVMRAEREELDNSAVVDLCLHNRNWVRKLFMDLKGLVEDRSDKS